MRILGFSEKWRKLQENTFTTFRFLRKDKDWEVGEIVQVVYRPRSKNREILGTAKIIAKEKKYILPEWTILPYIINHVEAVADGFPNVFALRLWMIEQYGKRRLIEPMNKLILGWIDDKQSWGMSIDD